MLVLIVMAMTVVIRGRRLQNNKKIHNPLFSSIAESQRKTPFPGSRVGDCREEVVFWVGSEVAELRGFGGVDGAEDEVGSREFVGVEGGGGHCAGLGRWVM